MAKIDVAQFLGKAKEYTIMGQKVSIEPLQGKDLDLLMGIKEGDESAGVRRLVIASFDLSDEEYDKLPVSFINEAAECILDANGLKK